MIKERGADGAIFQADVTKPEQIERLFKEVRSRFPSLDIFVSNARPEAFRSSGRVRVAIATGQEVTR